MRKHIKYYQITSFFLFLCLLISTSCDERIPWDVDPEQRRIIVEGRITDELKQHEILLRVSNDFFDPENPSYVTGAEITVTDGSNTFSFAEDETGRYLSQETFAGEVGHTYELNIELATPIGDQARYTASSLMKRNLSLDSLSAPKEEIDELFTEESEDSTYYFRFFGQEPEGTGDHYLCELWRNDENYTDPIYNVVIFEDDFIDGIEFDDFDLFAAIDFDQEVAFGTGDVATLRIYSIEEQYYNFLIAFLNQEEGGDPFGFSSPPANVDGNISGTGLGYFYAASMASASTVLED